MIKKQNAKNHSEKSTLKLKRLGIDTYHENVAYLHRDCVLYRAEGFQALSKVEICSNGKHILAVLNVVDDTGFVTTDELGLSEEAFERLAEKEGQQVSVEHAEPPASMDAVRRKIAGERLDQNDFNAIIGDITESRYSKTEISTDFSSS